VPVLDLGGLTLALGLLTFLVAGTVKGTLGIGLPLVAVPLLATVLDLPTAIALMVVPVLTSNFIQALQGKRKLATLRRFFPLLLTLIPGTIIAAQFVSSIDLRTGSLVLGVIVVLFSISQLVRVEFAISTTQERFLNPVVGLFAGFLGGLSNLFGPPLIMYLVALKLEKDDFVTTIGLLFIVAAVTLYATLATVGVLTFENAAGSLVAAIPVMAGVFIGTRLRNHIDQKTFQRILMIVLVIVGLNLIRRGLFG
jgi:uncharacterized membrane protein YfcA